MNQSDSLFGQCQAVCSQWTQKDVKCPIEVKDGNMVTACYGFGVKFPDKFMAMDQQVTHTPACYPKNGDWNVKFQPAEDAGDCTYKKTPPGGQFCASSR